MIKYFSILILAVVLINSTAFSYNKVAVQNGTNVSYFDDLPAAVTAASPGATIYLPGGSYTGCTINKKLNIIGVGHYPVATQATGQTIVGDLYLMTNSDSTSITGVYGANLFFGNNYNQKISNININRCRFNNASSYYNNDSIINSNFTESIFNSFGAIPGYYYSLVISKCVFYGYPTSSTCSISNVTNSLIENSLFLLFVQYDSNYGFCSNSSNNIIRNNIISCYSNTSTHLGSNNLYQNNIFLNATFSFPNGTNFGSNNIMNQTLSSTFENVLYYPFYYSNDYHLKATSPGKNAGTDGTDIGIYGTNIPYKENAIPFNPHLNSSTIPSQSINGTLPINIQVQAQTR